MNRGAGGRGPRVEKQASCDQCKNIFLVDELGEMEITWTRLDGKKIHKIKYTCIGCAKRA